MKIRPLKNKLQKYAVPHYLTKKLVKQIQLFEQNPNHPSLNMEKLAPKEFGLYSFRIDRKYRAIFHILPSGDVEIVDINDNYQ